MPAAFTPVITSAGVAAALAADGNALQLEITHVVLGAAAYAPVGNETALADRREKAAVSGGAITGANQVTISAVFRSTAYSGAAYNIGEIGFYAGDPDAGGVLFALASQAGENFGGRGSSSVIEFLATFVLNLSGVPSGSVTVTVDPQAGAAYLLLTSHEGAANPHPQYVRKAGDTMTGALTLWGNAAAPLQAVPLQQLDAALAAIDSMPVGAVTGFLALTPPAGWLHLNGAVLSRASYPDLFAHANAQGMVVNEAAWAASNWTLFSNGDGSTTFRVPDWRGEFVRASDSGRGVDPLRSIGTWQAWGTARPRTLSAVGVVDGGATRTPHNSANTPFPDLSINPATVGFVRATKAGNSATAAGADTNGAGQQIDVINVMQGDPETRPRNGAVLLCVKAGPRTIPAAPPPAASPAPVAAPPAAPAPPPATVAPVAEFIGTPTSPAADSGSSVQFTDQSTGGPTAWLWEFGDGGTSTLQNPNYTYSAWGIAYTVRLTASNAAGSNQRTRVGYITVTPPSGI